MNQRSSRNNDKKNNLDFMSISTGGLTARHAPNEDPQVQVPQKTTGDIKQEPKPQTGVAKASPNFKPIAPPEKAPTKEDEKKVIAKNSTPVEDDTSTKEDA